MTRIPAIFAALMLPVLANAGPDHVPSARATWQPASDSLDNAAIFDATYLTELKQGTYLSARVRIVSGYAAIVGSKFTSATPTQIANQLLNTARTDTLSNYSPGIHGRGEASIARAIAPTSIK